MVLKIEPDWSVRSSQLDWEAIELELNCLNRQFDWRTRRTSRFPPDPTIHFPSPFPMQLVPLLSPGASSHQQHPQRWEPRPTSPTAR